MRKSLNQQRKATHRNRSYGIWVICSVVIICAFKLLRLVVKNNSVEKDRVDGSVNAGQTIVRIPKVSAANNVNNVSGMRTVNSCD